MQLHFKFIVRKNMKRVFLLMIALIVFTSSGNSAEKRILIEQFTSSGCGWCVDGTYHLDSLIKKYPGQIIGIRHHTGDGMATEQSEGLYNAQGAAGVPTASLNRLDFTGKVSDAENPYLIGRENWFSFVKDLLNESPETDVTCSWYFDESLGKIKGLVVSSLLKDLQYQQTLNAIVLENSVTGTGDGFDQKNYYSKLEGEENHPYYNKPALLVGYEHNKVSRYSLGGLWGEKMNIKKPGNIGESYQWSFSIDVPKPPSGNPINIGNIDVIGISAIDEPGISDVLNCAKGVKEIPKTTFLSSTNGTVFFANSKVTVNMKIENFTETDNDYEVIIETKGYGAKNWLINVEKNNFSIKSGNFSDFNIEITPNSEGMKQFRVILKDKNNNTFYAFNDITVYNNETKKVAILEPESIMFWNMDELAKINYDDFIWMTTSQYYEYKNQLPNTKLILLDFTFYIYLSNYTVDFFNELTNDGKKLFVMGNIIAEETKNYSKLTTFFDNLGFKFNEQYTNFDDLQNKTINISGYNGDPISNKSNMTLMPSQYREDYSAFVISNYNKARPVFSATKNPNSVLAFRSALNNQRIIVSSFNFYNIKNEDLRKDYINKSINWLMDGSGEDQAHLSISTTNLNFNLVEISKSDTLDFYIRNYGTSDLVLTSPTIVSESAEFFAVQPLANQTINPGDSLIIKIGFTPKSKSQAKGYIYFKANDPYRDSIAVSFRGAGRTSVEDDLSLISSIKTSPNPITQSATITVQFENNIQNVTVNLIDLQGRVIKQIANGDFFAGTYTFNLSTNNLNSGSYFIQITNDASTLCQPVIIDK